MIQLPDAVKITKKDGNRATFEIGPLMPGYGATIANPLRRVLLSSLEGAAITSIKIAGVEHEFGAIPGIQEDVIEIILNLKRIRVRSFSSEPVIMKLSAKGEGAVTAAKIEAPSDLEIATPDQHICTITEKKGTLVIELTVEKGRGYQSVEERQKEKLPIGVIAIDAVYSPVQNVNFTVNDVRVGQRIDFNRINMEIVTDGTVGPEQALRDATRILKDHFDLVAQVPVPEPTEPKPKKKAPAKKTAKKSKK